MLRRTHTESSRYIPLNRLKKSPKNVRQVPHSTAHIQALADSIKVKGQLQNLVVEPELDDQGRATGDYLVSVGEGRRLAQRLRVKRKEISSNEPIRCVIDTTHDGREISLAENVIRNDMHPADQFEAFKALIDAGQSVEDVAAHFSVAPLVVQRRLRLANVAPEFLALYREGEVSLEHLMALAITEDHEKQRLAWKGLSEFNRSAHALRRALTENEMSMRAPLARFVGAAYEKAGGQLRRDLFGEPDDKFVLDVDLLKRLATQKLEKHAARIKAEGSAWVEIGPELQYADLAAFGRVGTTLREPTKNEAAKLQKLAEALSKIEEEARALGDDEERIAVLEERADELRDQEQQIEDARTIPDPEQAALAGALVAIDDEGKLRIERGLLKPQEKRRFSQQKKAATAQPGAPSRTHSAALLRRLTAHRAMALQATLAQRADVALVALTHRLVSKTFFPLEHAKSAVQIDARRSALESYSADLKDCKARAALDAQHQALATRLPREAETLFAWLLAQPQAEVLALLAFCVALTVDAVQADESPHAADALAGAAGLDMREWWTATAENYLGSVPRARVLAVVTEAVSAEAAAPLARLKKAPLAIAAEQAIAAARWVPEFFRPSGGA